MSFKDLRETAGELVVLLNLKVNQLCIRLEALFLAGQERLSPQERLERAESAIRFADQLIGSLETVLVPLRAARDKAKEARDRFIHAQGSRPGFNSA